jgi:hypothetical protein
MNVSANGMRRWLGRVRRLTSRQRTVAYLLLAVLLGVGGPAAAVAGRATRGGSVVAMGATVILLMSVPLLRTVAGRGRHLVRRGRRLAGNRGAGLGLHPSGPPIEQLAYDLRRLLWRHEELSRSSDPAHAKWLKALEAAISSRAIAAARALDVSHENPPPYSGLGTEELSRLLRALAVEGLVLPYEVGLLTPGGRH